MTQCNNSSIYQVLTLNNYKPRFQATLETQRDGLVYTLHAHARTLLQKEGNPCQYLWILSVK